MKKFKEIFKSSLIKYIISCLMIISAIVTYQVVADEKIEVVKVTGDYGDYAALYSNGEIYTWGNYMGNNVIENAKNFVILDSYRVVYTNSDNELHRFDSSHGEGYKYKKLTSDIKQLYEFDEEVAFFLTNDNKLYAVDNGHGSISQIISSYEETEEIFYIMDNVVDIKTFGSYILIRDNNNVLYALGENYFGKKINEGNYLTTVTKLLDNVNYYDGDYAITNNNDLYIFSSQLAKPTIIKNNVKEVGYFGDYHYGYYNFSFTDMNNSSYYIEYTINLDSIVINNEYILENKIDDIYGEFYLIGNTLYYGKEYYDNDLDEYTTTYIKALDNIVKFTNGKALTEDGTFYTVTSPKYITGLENVSEIKINDCIYKITEKVKNFSLGTGSSEVVFLIMENDTIMAYGYNTEYDDLFNNKTIIDSEIPVVIIGLPNIAETIDVYNIELSTLNKTKFTVGDTFDYYVNIFPYNATNKSVIWESSNEEVATVNKEGLITTKSVGSTIISVKTSDGSFVRSQEINVYPKVNSIEITNGGSVDLEIYEDVVLTANVKPDDTLENEIVWSTDDEDNIELYNSYWNEDDERIIVDSNQIVLRVYAGGTYTVTASTKNGLYSDTITINTVQKVSNIQLDIDEEHYDGVNNAFIYLSESSTLDIGYKIYPTTATNQNVTWTSSDKDVATVDSTGKITAYKTGRTRITISSVDGGTTRSFNVLVYNYAQDNVIVGDVNGDGEVNILDLIKLRRYLAGLEESLQ